MVRAQRARVGAANAIRLAPDHEEQQETESVVEHQPEAEIAANVDNGSVAAAPVVHDAVLDSVAKQVCYLSNAEMPLLHSTKQYILA